MALAQYESLRSALGKVMQHSGWVVHQRSFVAGARSLNEEEFKENLEYFKVPSMSRHLEYLEYFKVAYVSTVDLTPEAPPLAQTPEVPTTGRPQSTQIGILYLLSSTLSRCVSLTN